MDVRSERVVVLAHCLLNANTRVHDVATWPGALSAVVSPLVEQGVGLIQLPCPEAGLLGMKRWAATREQYDVAALRREMRRIVRPTVDVVEALVRDGVVVEAVLGVPGSPSCGVYETSEGFSGGRPDGSQHSRRVAGSGVFMQELAEMLLERGLDIPFRDADTTAV